MDRIIQPYPSPNSGTPARPAGPATSPATAPTGHPAKSPADYARAVRRHAWLVVLVALLVTVPGAVLVSRQADFYRSTVQIKIEPPRYDPAQVNFLVHGSVAAHDRDSIEKYVPTRLVRLKGRDLAERVVGDPSVKHVLGPGGDPAAELIGGLTVQKLAGTSLVNISLEGRSPEWSATLLETLVDVFRKQCKDEGQDATKDSMKFARETLDKLEKDEEHGLARINKEIDDLVKKNPAVFTPSGGNMMEEELSLLKSELRQGRTRFEDLSHQARIARLFPHAKGTPPPSPNQRKIEQLLAQREDLLGRLDLARRIVRKPGDLTVRQLDDQLRRAEVNLGRLQNQAAASAPDLTKMMLDRSRFEVDKVAKDLRGLLGSMQQAMPIYQQYLTRVRERDEKEREIATVRGRIRDFEILSNSQSEPVQPVESATLPAGPSGPNRTLQMAIVVAAGVALGLGLVLGLEWLDHRVKVPEQLTSGLSLPLFGVVPRIRRIARVHRGGHLWTPGAPDSLAADAYRNLRASLLGLQGAKGPLVTLLVTSAKSGEGKSTTALNLAATCARSGERTLLMDCDLRRPSLRGVFADDGHDVGLVDCLRGEVPWQRVLVRTDLPNLDFLPTGDPGGTPIEILGSLELRQLVAAVAGHYDRVILDGPAVLGLADCRMLGRVVDSALLVVRSGAHELRPLQRAKAMLEQSRVHIAGLVFNGLSDDLENWSSYGPQSSYEAGDAEGDGGPSDRSPRGLDAPRTGRADAMASGPARA